MKLNLQDIGRDDMTREGIYSIATRDLGAQYYMIKRQPRSATFVPGKLVVYKVELIQTFHEEKMYKRKRWDIWFSRTMEQMLAYKMFAFASNQGIYVWKRYQDSNYPLGDAKTIADTPPTIRITAEETAEEHQGYRLMEHQRRNRYDRLAQRSNHLPTGKTTTDVSLWQAYAKILWSYIEHSQGREPRIDSEGREVVARLTEEIPGGALRQLGTGILD